MCAERNLEWTNKKCHIASLAVTQEFHSQRCQISSQVISREHRISFKHPFSIGFVPFAQDVHSDTSGIRLFQAVVSFLHALGTRRTQGQRSHSDLGERFLACHYAARASSWCHQHVSQRVLHKSSLALMRLSKMYISGMSTALFSPSKTPLFPSPSHSRPGARVFRVRHHWLDTRPPLNTLA